MTGMDYRTSSIQFQFTHPGRGATVVIDLASLLVAVSIHAPREGCDLLVAFARCLPLSFNSRTPGGVRPRSDLRSWCRYPVSIHAPREGCDARRERSVLICSSFQFTHPGRGATIINYPISMTSIVSIHAPREGCDDTDSTNFPDPNCFNSRTPGGVRPEERTRARSEVGFNSRTPGGVRPRIGSLRISSPWFQFTHPGRGAT